MKTYLQLRKANEYNLPPEFQGDDVRFGDDLVEYFLNEFTEEGGLVFDPFAGYGTTLYVAEELGRVGYGVEYNEQKARFIRARLKHPDHLTHGDARKLAAYDLPLFDFCLTSPPYTPKEDKENPFTDYSEKGYSYSAYLQDFRRIYEQIAQIMKPSARIVIEIANLKTDQGITTLAWDVAHEVSKVLAFEGEIVVCSDEYGFGYDHSYCLVFFQSKEMLWVKHTHSQLLLKTRAVEGRSCAFLLTWNRFLGRSASRSRRRLMANPIAARSSAWASRATS